MSDFVSRRSLLAGTLLAPAALAQTAKVQREGGDYWTQEYWAEKNANVKLYMYRKRTAAPKAGEAPLPALLLVHGSSMSGRSSYDLATPGKGEYSLMNAFAGFGYDVWTLDHENYGKSSQTESNSDVANGVEDLKAGVELIARETGQQRIHMFGESSGGIRAGAYAMVRPERVGRLALSAFSYTGKGSPTLAERAKNLPAYRANNRRKRDREMIRSIFTRDKPGTTDPAIAEFLADAELPFGDQVPTGTYLDMTANLPLLDPKEVQSPVLMIQGQYDGNSTLEDQLDFYRQLPTGDRQFVIVPDAAHNLVLSNSRRLMWHAVHAFLSMPKSTPV